MNKPFLLVSLTLLTVFILSVLFLPGFSSFSRKVSNHYIYHSLEETKAPNVVSSIVWDYRAYDTLGEETVLFAAALGVFTLFRKLHPGDKK